MSEREKNSLKVGLIGCGSMGSELARAVQRGEGGPTKIIGLFDEYAPGRNALAEELGRNQEPAPVEADTVAELIGLTGMQLIVEAVRQLRGEGGERQVDDPEIALVSGQGGIMHSHATMILRN